MRNSTWQALEEMFTQFPIMMASAVSDKEISAAASSIGCVFHPDYAEFLRRFGGAVIGAYPIFGLRKPDVGGEPWSVVAATTRFRAQKWPGTEELYVISEDGSGNPIGVSANGNVLISYPNIPELKLIATDFEEFITRTCLSQVK